MQQAGEPHAGEPVAGESELGGDQRGELGDRLAVAACVGVLRVHGARERGGERLGVPLVDPRRVTGGVHLERVDRGVLAQRLGAQQGHVGFADELVARAQRLGFGDARRGGEAGQRGAQSLRELERAPRTGVREDDGELVSADAVGLICATHRRAQRVGERADALVARLVAVRVVERLEIVEVDQRQGQRQARARGVLQLAREVLMKYAVVAQAGERIRAGHLREALKLLCAGSVEPASLRAQQQTEQREDARRGHDHDHRATNDGVQLRARVLAELARAVGGVIGVASEGVAEIRGQCPRHVRAGGVCEHRGREAPVRGMIRPQVGRALAPASASAASTSAAARACAVASRVSSALCSRLCATYASRYA